MKTTANQTKPGVYTLKRIGEEVMKLKVRKFACIASALLFTTAMLAEVKTDYDRSANFSQYKTYSWADLKSGDALWIPRIQNAVNARLAEKGWTQVPSGGDVAIIAFAIGRDQPALNTFWDGMGGPWGLAGGFGQARTTVEHYQEGTLVVNLFDANTKTLIWRGSASGTLSGKSAKDIKNVDKTVQKMFAHFPPTPKG